MFYLFSDLHFQGRPVRLIRSEDGQHPLSDQFRALIQLTRKENEGLTVLMLPEPGSGDTFNDLKTQEEVDFWRSFTRVMSVHYDNYKWTRAFAQL